MSTWPTVSLADVATIERSSIQPEQIKSGTIYLGLEDIMSGGLIAEPKPVDAGVLASSKFHFTHHHLLYGKLRPYLAKIASPDFSGICSTDILPILPGPNVSKRFLLHFLRQPSMVDYATSRSVGANLPRLSPSVLEEFPIPLPPLTEQQRIATILDKAHELRAKRKTSLVRLDALSEAIFAELFGNADSPERAIADLLDSGSLQLHKDGNYGSMYPRADDFGDKGVPFLTAKAVTDDGMIDEVSVDRLREEKASKMTFGWISKGDVLLAHNASVGKVALYDGRFERALIGTSLTAFRPNPDALDSRYLAAALRSGRFQNQLQKNMGQTTRNQVPIKAQRSLRIPEPPLTLQREFAARVAAVEKLRASHLASLAEMDALFGSLQHRAFRGEL